MSLAVQRVPSSVMRNEESFELPAWIDCSWRRIACGRNDCPICGRVERDRQKHEMRGEDPDDAQVMMEDLAESLRETIVTIHKMAAEMNIDLSNLDDVDPEPQPPEPKAFRLYRDVWAWREEVDRVTNEAELNGAFWPYTEDAEDLGWYKNTLCTKVYRQLCNRWQLERGNEDVWTDYEYSHRVLHECCELLERALKRISSPEDPLRHTAASLLEQFYLIEERILAI